MSATYFPQLETSPQPLRPRQPNSRQRVLVVDDDAIIRRLNTHVLTCSGYQVDAAEDGAIAWVAMQRENYDLIVTDNNMPNMTGVELLQSLHEARHGLPVIMATSDFPGTEMDRRPWLQIQATLIKPYSFNELLATVKNVLHASANNLGEPAPPPNWPGEPLPDRQSL